MILSILIPTYNYCARALARDLCQIIDRERIDAEVIIGDDASTDDTAWLDEVSKWEHVRVLRFRNNAGRAAHRNRMAEATEAEWLLFIDCDAQVEVDFSLQAYLDVRTQAPVICGGLRHPAVNPCPEATLRYTYERATDRHRSAAERMQRPYAHFTPFNLLIRRDVFLSIRFDEACKEYGHEDTLFGVELKQQGVPVLHIDNPLVHIGLEPNEVYLQKTETALRTLKHLNGRMRGYSHVENAAICLQRFHLTWAMKAFYRLFQQSMRRNLLGKHPSLTLFSLYKLGYFLNLSPHS